MAENYEGEATGYPSEVEMETQETPSPNFVVTLNSLAGTPRLVDGDGNDFPTDDETGVITIDTGGDSGNTVHYMVQTPTAPEKLIARTNIGVGEADTPSLSGLLIRATNGADEVLASWNATENTSVDTDWRVSVFGLNIKVMEGGAGYEAVDPTRIGWGWAMETNYLDLNGVLQNELYLTTHGNERPFAVGFSSSLAVTITGMTNPGGNTTRVTFTANPDVPDYLFVGMRVRFTALTNPTGSIALNTIYKVISIENATTFVIGDQNGANIVGDADAGSIMNRGGWGNVGSLVPFSVHVGQSGTEAYSNYLNIAVPGEALAAFVNSQAAHYAEVSILNHAAASHQAYINFDDKWRAGNGAVYGNLSTSFDISPVNYTSFVAWSMNLTTGHVKMGYADDALATAPLSMLDVNGTVTATAFVGDGSGLTGVGGVPTTITVANEATDTTCFPLFATAATGDLGPKTNAGLAFDSATGLLTAVTFGGIGSFAALTATGNVNFISNGQNITISPTGIGVLTINPAASGLMDNVRIGLTTPAQGEFTTLNASDFTIASVAVPTISSTSTLTNKTFVAPVLGAATGTSLALGGATIGGHALAWTGTANGSGALTIGGQYLGAAGNAAGPGISFSGDPNTGFFSRAGDFISLGMGGTERITLGYSATGTAGIIVASTSAIGFNGGADTSSGGFTATAAFFTREGNSIIRLGNNGAGPEHYTLKSADRITSDGVGADLTIAGGRNRGASVGGSLIFQTSPAAGAGVTGTLATRLTISSTGLATFTGDVSVPTKTPATAGATGTTGTIAWDADYIYICVATDTWKRVAIATW